MKRYGSIIRLRPEYEERYVILHRHVFPQVLKTIHLCNIRNYSIFLREGVLFATFEYHGTSLPKDMKRMAADGVTQEWWKLTTPMQEPFASREKGEWWASLEQVITLGARAARPRLRSAAVAEVGEGNAERIRELIVREAAQLFPAFSRVKGRSLSLFLKDHQLYLYTEYTGAHPERAEQRLMKSQPWKSWEENLRPFVRTEDGYGSPWSLMREVFYTP